MITIDPEKLTAVLGCSYCFNDPTDPIRQTIEKRIGKILKVVSITDGSWVTICIKAEE